MPNAHGVFGANNSPDPSGAGVAGENAAGTGMLGTTQSSSASAILGSNSATADTPAGTVAGHGVFGLTTVPNGHGVFGANNSPNPTGAGVAGENAAGTGVLGSTQSSSASAIFGNNSATDPTPQGTVAGYGVFGLTTVPNSSGVFGANNAGGTGGTGVTAVSQNGTGLFATGGQAAAVFDGNVQLNGTLTVTDDILLTNADCAEEFELTTPATVEPGTVMVIDVDGGVTASSRPYDTRVAGVVSGAGPYRPALVLDRRRGSAHRVPLALLGKVCCRVDAAYGPIAPGDLLTTSPTPGHAMSASDPSRTAGAIIGKALGPLVDGRGLVPVLVGLR